jgi:hypothetical protein
VHQLGLGAIFRPLGVWFVASNHHKASKQLKQINMLKAGTSSFGVENKVHISCA